MTVEGIGGSTFGSRSCSGGLKSAYRAGEMFHRLRVAVPTCHQADLPWAPLIKIEALLAQAAGLLVGNLQENFVRLDRIDEAVGRCRGELLRRSVRSARILNPKIVLKH